jgi:ATP-dependent DNA helicase RecQ
MKCAVYILRKIKAGERELQAEKKFSREMIEKVVYHLSVIGVIEDWTVDWNKDSIKVYLVNGYTFESVCQSANRYISNYGTDYKITPENEFIVRNAEKFKDIKEILVLGLFYNWYKEKIISYRKQSLINVVETCERFEKEGPDVFKNTIESYFRLSDITSLVSQIADNPNHYEDWFQVFSQAKTDQISMKEISISMGRFLESFNNNVAIDFLSGIANMLADTFESMNGRRRLKQAMEVINEYEPSDRIYILNETMKLVADQKNPMLNETFSEFFIQEMNVDGIETMIYNALKDNYSLKTVLEVSMKKIADYVR